MTCCNQCASSYGLAGFGLGELSLAPMWAGDRFSFGVEITLGWGSAFSSYEQIAQWIEQAGLSYDTRSYKLSGTINPFVVIEGRAAQNFESASELRDAIFYILASQVWANAGTIRFEAETHPDGSSNPTQRIDTPQGSGPSLPGIIASPINSLAQSLGITQSQALIAGIALAIVGVVVLKKAL